MINMEENKEITWKEAIFAKKGLKDIRIENKLEIPEYYRESTWRLAISLSIHSLFCGALIGGLFVYMTMVI